MKNLTESKEKFGLLIDLGIIKVPSNYSHNNQIRNYFGQISTLYPPLRDNITDAQYANPECILEPGDKFWARIFKQVGNNYKTSTKECKDFLSSQGVIYVGVQGASLILKEKLKILPPSFSYVSFYDSNTLLSCNNVIFEIFAGEKYFGGLIRAKNKVKITVLLNDEGWGMNTAFICATKC